MLRPFLLVLVLFPLTSCGPRQSTGKQEASKAAQPDSTPAKASGESAESADPTASLKGALGVVGTRKLYVEDIDTLLLFADERLEAQQIIADWGTAVGFEIIDPKEVHRIVQQAAAGKNPTSGEACGPPLQQAWATNRWLPGLGAAGHFKAAVYCQPDCSLQLSLQLDGQGTEFFAAPFDSSAPWQEELHRSLRRLRDNGGHGQHGHLNNPIDVPGTKRSSELGDWVADEADHLDAPKALLDKAASCGLARGQAQLLVQETADGATRCEGTETVAGSTTSAAKTASCLCDALVLPGETPRTLLTVFPWLVPATPSLSSKGMDVSASIFKEGRYGDAPWTERMFYEGCEESYHCDKVSECFGERTAPIASTRLGLTVSFDKDGVATRVAIADFEQLLMPQEHACVVKKLMTLRIPCPDSPTSTRKAKLDLRVDAPEAKSP